MKTEMMVKKNKSKKLLGFFGVANLGKVMIAATVTMGLLLSGVAGARAGLLDELKKLGVVNDALNQFTKVADIFSSGIKNFSDITDVKSITGVLGQFAPEKAKQAIDNKIDANNPLSSVLKQGTSALATSSLAADQVLSEPAQAAAKETKDKIKQLDQGTVDLANQVFDDATAAQGLSSSQDVLKRISYQMSGQADINAAQVRLAVLQNNGVQEVTTQLAAANATNASREEREMGERQDRILQENQNSLSLIKSNILHYNQKLF